MKRTEGMEPASTPSIEEPGGSSMDTHEGIATTSNAEPSSSWSLVTGKKRNSTVESRDPRKHAKTASGQATPTTVSNSFEVLNNLNIEEQPGSNIAPQAAKPPPIHINDVQNYAALIKFLEANTGANSFTLKTTIKGVTVYPSTPDIYRKLVTSLRNEGAEFHTFQLPEDKNIRIVIKNLHPTTPISEIKADLEHHGYIAINITNAISYRYKIPLPMFFVDISKDSYNDQIFDINRIYYTSVIIEEPRKKRIIPQCIRCQKYGHTRGYCNHSPRCVKCGLGHESASCTKSRATPAICANCRGAHPANYRGCQVLKDLRAQRTLRNKLRQQNSPTPPGLEEYPVLQQPHHRSTQNVTDSSVQQQGPPMHQQPQRPHNGTSAPQNKPTCSGVRREVTQQPPSSNNQVFPQLFQILNGLNSLIQPLFTLLQQLAQVTQVMCPPNGQ